LRLCGVGIKRAVAPGSRATWKVNKAKMTRTATSTAYERWKSIFRHSVCAKHDSYGRVEGVTSRRKAHSSMVSTLLICKRPEIRRPSSHRMGHYYWQRVDLRTSSFAWTQVVEQGFHRVPPLSGPSPNRLSGHYIYPTARYVIGVILAAAFAKVGGGRFLHRVLTSAVHDCALRKKAWRKTGGLFRPAACGCRYFGVVRWMLMWCVAALKFTCRVIFSRLTES
jgi:hypothetical protein